jgi:CHASE3 domain sensor protein
MQSIRRQLIRTQTFSWIITAVFGAMVLFGIARQASFNAQILDSEIQLVQVERILSGMLGLSTALRNHALTGSGGDLERLRNQEALLGSSLAELRGETSDRIGRKILTWKN